jgi:hypothetical protein
LQVFAKYLIDIAAIDGIMPHCLAISVMVILPARREATRWAGIWKVVGLLWRKVIHAVSFVPV